MGLHVGVVSSHGHEDGHILVWDKLPEVKSIHVCTIADEAGPGLHLVAVVQGRFEEPQPVGSPEQATRRRGASACGPTWAPRHCGRS